jgi:hypothetical protein
MEILSSIQEKFNLNLFEFSKHAADRMILRHITVSEIREAIDSGEVIEDYPQDKYGPSCLILGKTKQKRFLHIQCSYPSRSLVKVITVYEPDPNEWSSFRVRKSK